MVKRLSLIALFICSSISAMKIDYDIVYDTFAGVKKNYPIRQFTKHVKIIEIPSTDPNNKEPYHFFGIHEDDQSKIDFRALKKKITKLMNIPNTNAIQIIGDSGKFSEAGTKKGRRFLRAQIDDAHLVEYGFTGYKSEDKKELDINSFVNEYADEKPLVAKKVLANILGHTPVAIKKWGTYGSPNIHNYVVVYNDYDMTKEPEYKDGKKVSGFTTFGNDITASDHLLQADQGDKFICLEGGVQSFLQVINALQLKTPVTLVYNLRKPEREKFFSATRYLKKVADAYNANKKLTQKQVQDIFDNYEKELNSIWDPSKADYQTKKELFDMAMKRFITDRLYKKVAELCTFIDGNTLPE